LPLASSDPSSPRARRTSAKTISKSARRSPANVFAVVADVRNDPQWHTDILKAQLTSGTLVANGTTFTTRFKPFVGLSEGTGIVTAYEPPHRFVVEERMGKFEPKTILIIDPDGSGSQITRRVEMEPAGLLRLVTPFMGGMMRKQATGFLANLKRVLEAG
jgi:uncharacterized protein YndB with AHSA1/START domain